MLQIAEATLQVAERGGVKAITIRSVAAEMGGSSAVITNYLATRADLLLNAVLYVQRTWDEGMNDAIRGLEGFELLRALVLWSVSTEPSDPIVRRIWVELMTESGSDEVTQALIDISLRHRDLLREVLAEQDQAGSVSPGAGSDENDPDIQADMLYLMIRGFYLLSVENPGDWGDHRINRTMDFAIARLR